MDEVLKEEEIYQFNEFKHSDAYDFGMSVLKIVKEQNLNAVRIRVKYDDDIVFQYLMDGKNGEMWLDRKEKTVMETGHSSLYVFLHQEDYSSMIDDEKYAICGGGFPLVVNGQLRGAFMVSGLRHTEDHDLIIQALKKMEDK